MQINDLKGAFIAPKRTFKRMKNRTNSKIATLVALIIMFLTAIITYLSFTATTKGQTLLVEFIYTRISPEVFGPLVIVVGTIALFVSLLLLSIFSTFLVGISSKKRRAYFERTYSMMAYSFVVPFVYSIIGAIGAALGATANILGPLGLLALFWFIAVAGIAVSRANDISTDRGIAIFFISLIITVLILVGCALAF